MPDELDLVRMGRRKVSYATVTANLVHHAFLHHAADDMELLIAEIHRLRALVATEQAKTNHARCWAHWHQNENPFTLNPVDYPRIDERASDGWYGASGSFDAPDEVGEE